MAKIFEYLAQKIRNFNHWFATGWNKIIKKLLIKF